MGRAVAAVGQPHEPRPAVHARRGSYLTRLTSAQRQARDRQRQPQAEDFTSLVGDISSTEIERRYQAHLAYLRATRSADALVSGSIASSLSGSAGLPTWFRW